MKVNKTYEILHIDRNFFDSFNAAELRGEHKASDLMSGNYFSKYTKHPWPNLNSSSCQYYAGISGTTVLDYGDGESSVELQTQWHVDLGHMWYPLYNGRVPVVCEDIQWFTLGQHSGKHWTSLPKDMKVGWRGPCILKKNMNVIGEIMV